MVRSNRPDMQRLTQEAHLDPDIVQVHLSESLYQAVLNAQCSLKGPRLAQHTVIEGQADDGFLVATILSLDFSSLYTPEPGQVVRRSCDDVLGIP